MQSEKSPVYFSAMKELILEIKKNENKPNRPKNSGSVEVRANVSNTDSTEA